MTEVENLVLEHLKPFPAQMARVEEMVDGLATDLSGVKHMAAFLTSEGPGRGSRVDQESPGTH